MISSAHITSGAALGLLIGAAVPDQAIAIPLALVAGLGSHHLLDMIPHTDPGSFRSPDDHGPTKPKEMLFALPDNLIATALVLYVFFVHQSSWPMLLGAVGGNLPDVLHNVDAWSDFARQRFLPGYYRFHQQFHWTARGNQVPVGILTNLLVITGSAWILFR